MSRSGYSDDCWDDPNANWAIIRWRGAVASALRGKRGQAFLRELRDALDAMPNKRLVSHTFIRGEEVCALGAVGVARRKDMREINQTVMRELCDPGYCDPADEVAHFFGIPRAMAAEIMYMNDEVAESYGNKESTAERKWVLMRSWVEQCIK